jgi:Zn-dependent M16 (insulinase) family peptidase
MSRADAALDTLKPDQVIHGFRAAAVYVDADHAIMGARFLHARTGFELHFLRIESVPQAQVWVNSFARTDMGEPHTQEHLLLLKGNKGRSLLDFQMISLTTENAFTEQWRTSYVFNTVAGADEFYKMFEHEVDALLHPDYADEEIRREVRNFGVVEDPHTHQLGLEEKGAVYNEMVSSFARPSARVEHAIHVDLYGAGHPLSNVSGGLPSAMVALTPAQIHAFHRATYHLGNMGMVVSMPHDVPLADALQAIDQALGRLEPQLSSEKFMTEADLPSPQPLAPGRIDLIAYPGKSDQAPALVEMAWPATRKLDTTERALLELFLGNLAGDATANLYKRFIDRKTRALDVGTTGVAAWFDDDQGAPVYVRFRDVSPAGLTEARLDEMRRHVLDEVSRIAAFKDGSPELAEFNARARNRLKKMRRDLAKWTSSPPRFGIRSAYSRWMWHLHRLDRQSQFRRSVTLEPELNAVERLIGGNKNVWREAIERWQLASVPPYVAAAFASVDQLKREERERQDRLRAEITRLASQYGLKDPQAALKRYRAEAQQRTVELERAAAKAHPLEAFTDHPPLTLDDSLRHRRSSLKDGIPLVTSTFDKMRSASVGLALRLDGVAERDWVYLSALPNLLSEVGVIERGRPLSYEQMEQRLQREVLDVDAHFNVSFASGRAELEVTGAGNDLEESRRAVGWMQSMLLHPNWRVDNLPRIRDVLDQLASSLRGRTQRGEESWVENPYVAYWRQDRPLLLATGSFLTRAHHVHRLRWLFKEATPTTRAEASAYLLRLAGAATQANPDQLVLLIQQLRGQAGKVPLPEQLSPLVTDAAKLAPASQALVRDAAGDLGELLGDLPDDSLIADWQYLCNQMRSDLAVTPEKALGRLENLRLQLIETRRARMWMTASPKLTPTLEASAQTLASALSRVAEPLAAQAPGERWIDARLHARSGGEKPIYVGLVVPNLKGGVFINGETVASYRDSDKERLLDFLAARLYGGNGSHSAYSKTLDAGLAYSNGMRYSLDAGQLRWYAERVPDLPQTLGHVISSVKHDSRDPSLAQYALAMAFRDARSAQEYDERGAAIADDFADGITPEVVTRFHRALLELASMPELARELFARVDRVYAPVLPGYGAPVAGRDRLPFVIGPEKQFRSYETYLKSTEGPSTVLHRLFPRDYWQPARD